jgi:hypothetical protein
VRHGKKEQESERKRERREVGGREGGVLYGMMCCMSYCTQNEWHVIKRQSDEQCETVLMCVLLQLSKI